MKRASLASLSLVLTMACGSDSTVTPPDDTYQYESNPRQRFRSRPAHSTARPNSAGESDRPFQRRI